MRQVMIAPEENLFRVPDGVSDQDACQFAVRPSSCLPADYYPCVLNPSSMPGSCFLAWRQPWSINLQDMATIVSRLIRANPMWSASILKKYPSYTVNAGCAQDRALTQAQQARR